MAEIISCPSCQRKLQVPETLAGQDVQCPTCSATFVAKVGDSQTSPGRRFDRRSEPEPWERDDEPRPYDDDRRYEDDGYRGRRNAEPHRGALILSLGVIGLVVFPLLCPIAWIMGNADLKEIRSGRMDPEGEGLTQAGRICGIAGTVLYGLCLCGCGFLICSGVMLGPDGH